MCHSRLDANSAPADKIGGRRRLQTRPLLSPVLFSACQVLLLPLSPLSVGRPTRKMTPNTCRPKTRTMTTTTTTTTTSATTARAQQQRAAGRLLLGKLPASRRESSKDKLRERAKAKNTLRPRSDGGAGAQFVRSFGRISLWRAAEFPRRRRGARARQGETFNGAQESNTSRELRPLLSAPRRRFSSAGSPSERSPAATAEPPREASSQQKNGKEERKEKKPLPGPNGPRKLPPAPVSLGRRMWPARGQ